MIVIDTKIDRDGEWIFDIYKNGELRKSLSFTRISHNIDAIIKSEVKKLESEDEKKS